MTRTRLDSKVFFSLLPTLLAGLAAGCVVHSTPGQRQPATPPARPAPGAPQSPAPDAPQSPQQPVAERCAVDAPVLYEITSAAVQTPDRPSRRLRILDSGAWLLSEDGNRRTGCLPEARMTELRTSLAGADFTPPPPPEISCAAVPTTVVTLTDPQGRRASYSTPCGKPASDSVHALVRKTEAWTRAAAEAPMQAPPDATPVCLMDGTPLYQETRWPARGGSAQGNTPTLELVVYPSGGWHYKSDGKTLQGCLSQARVRALRGRLDQAELAVQAVTGPRCKALPTHRSKIVTARGKVDWEAPCADAAPHGSVLDLQQTVHRAVGL